MRRRHGVASHSDDGDGSTLWLTLVCNYSQDKEQYCKVISCSSPGVVWFTLNAALTWCAMLCYW